MGLAYRSEHFISKPSRAGSRTAPPAKQVGYDTHKLHQTSAEGRRKIPDSFIRKILERHFNNLADAVLRETQYISSPSTIRRSPSFEKLVRLGDLSTKKLLQRLQRGDVRLVWLLALRAITNENPVPDHSKGIIKEMAASWLRWGQQKGLV